MIFVLLIFFSSFNCFNPVTFYNEESVFFTMYSLIYSIKSYFTSFYFNSFYAKEKMILLYSPDVVIRNNVVKVKKSSQTRFSFHIKKQRNTHFMATLLLGRPI